MLIRAHGFRELRFNSKLHDKGDASGFHFRALSGCIGLRRRRLSKVCGQGREGLSVLLQCIAGLADATDWLVPTEGRRALERSSWERCRRSYEATRLNLAASKKEVTKWVSVQLRPAGPGLIDLGLDVGAVEYRASPTNNITGVFS